MRWLGKLAVVVLLSIGMVFAVGCSGNDRAEGRIVVDGLGREVIVPETIETIVATGSSPRMIAYMGLSDKVVGASGMDWESVTPMTAYAYVNKEKWEDLPVVGSDAFGNTDYYPEVMIEAGPDVIFTTWSEDIANDIENKTGIPVVVLPEGTLFGEDYNQALRIIGETTGEEARAEEVIGYIDDVLADLDNRTKNIDESDRPTVISAAATYNGAKGIDGIRPNDPLLKALNANNPAEDEDYGTVLGIQVDKEQILLWDPDYIFCDFTGVPIVKEDFRENPSYYEELKAYKEGNIYQHPSSTSYFTNVELPLATGYFIGKTLYPSEFADVNIDDKVDEIIEFMLGEENYSQDIKDYGGYYQKLRL